MEGVLGASSQTVLASAGIAGFVLAWFMFRAEKKWDELIQQGLKVEASINRLARAQLLLTIASDSTPPSVKKLAEDLRSEIDEAEGERLERLKSRRGRSSPLP